MELGGCVDKKIVCEANMLITIPEILLKYSPKMLNEFSETDVMLLEEVFQLQLQRIT